jgi:DNA adenine methylase
MVGKIIGLFPPHRVYVEPFGGGAAVLLNKPPSPVEVYNDINKHIVNFFRVLRDPEKFELLYRRLSLTPHSREEHRYACERYADEALDEVERAALFWTATHQSLNGITCGSWSRTTWQSRRGMALRTSAWLGVIEGLPAVAERLLRVTIECSDFQKVIEAFDTPETLFYLDPPYLPEARVAKDTYEHEMSVEDHIRMLQTILKVQGMVLLSGYPNELYDGYLKDWRKVDFEVVTRSTTGESLDGGHVKAPRIERVWMNYDPTSVQSLFGEELL